MTGLDTAVYQYSVLTADAQADAARAVLTSGALSAIGGHYVPRLEHAVAHRIGRTGAVAIASATAGLELTLRALHIGPGDEVVIPELGWISIGTAATTTGATIRVAPVTEHLAPTWEQLAPLLTRRTRAVVLAHLRGIPAPDTPRITEQLRERDIVLIEDCAQAWAVHCHHRPAGAYGDVAVFSTQTHKLIATGEGGLVLTDNPTLLRRMRLLGGDTRIASRRPVWRDNTRMSEITAAIALPQLDHLDDLTATLRALQHPALQLVRDSNVVRTVLPEPDAIADSNGTTIGLWLHTTDQAEAVAGRLQQAGLRCWRPHGSDLHVACNWPTRPEPSTLDLRCYLDIKIPALAIDHHDEFLIALCQALTSST